MTNFDSVSLGGTGFAIRKKVATLKQGDYFGENALLRNEPRSATIKAMTEIKTLKITQEKFQELGSNKSNRTLVFYCLCVCLKK